THVAGPNISKLLSRDEAKLDMLITVKQDNTGVELEIDGYKALLAIGQWSEWIALSFKMGRNKFTTGNVKFCLSSIAPDLEFYMTPVQISPKDPAFVISSPDDYVKELAAQQGDFYTLGMPEDTKALEEKRIDEEAFIAMCDEIVDEQEKMMWFEMDRFEEGLLASTFFSTDRIQHMFWETKDRDHPLYSEEYERKYGHVIDDYYKKMDRILGDVMQKVDDQTALLVFSDHGFSTFRRTVHINTWLVQQGYMQLTQKVEAGDSEGGTLFQYVDWKNTQAYAVGFGSIYLNIKGREKTGIVEPGAAADALADKIVREMNQMKDPANGVVAIKKVYKNSDIYSGNLISESPDLVVGFEDGYRASWQTAIGGAPYELMEDNLKKWSGDHIVDPSVVPGILLSNHKIKIDDPGLMDIAPTVLSCFGMQDESMQGRVLI
ncbi:alkaline phosphatase family protein, partial [bacterium]|nr:alkaline phosphatase family protein [bacterium]